MRLLEPSDQPSVTAPPRKTPTAAANPPIDAVVKGRPGLGEVEMERPAQQERHGEEGDAVAGYMDPSVAPIAQVEATLPRTAS